MRKITTPHGEYLCKYVEEDGSWSFYTLPQYEEEFEGDFVSECYLPKEDPTDEELIEAFEWDYFDDQYHYVTHDSLIEVEMIQRVGRLDDEEHIHSNTYICENMELAVKLAKSIQYGFCIDHDIERKPHHRESIFKEIDEHTSGIVARSKDRYTLSTIITKVCVVSYKK